MAGPSSAQQISPLGREVTTVTDGDTVEALASRPWGALQALAARGTR
jgi:hypothetical protein